jgi:hypothetical protein
MATPEQVMAALRAKAPNVTDFPGDRPLNGPEPPFPDGPGDYGYSADGEVEQGPSTDKTAPLPPAIYATPYAWKDPTKITLRDWLYGFLLIRKFVTATVSPGAVGKSSLLTAEVLAMVSRKALLGILPKKQLRVWLWNLEDPQEET